MLRHVVERSLVFILCINLCIKYKYLVAIIERLKKLTTSITTNITTLFLLFETIKYF